MLTVPQLRNPGIEGSKDQLSNLKAALLTIETKQVSSAVLLVPWVLHCSPPLPSHPSPLSLSAHLCPLRPPASLVFWASGSPAEERAGAAEGEVCHQRSVGCCLFSLGVECGVRETEADCLVCSGSNSPVNTLTEPASCKDQPGCSFPGVKAAGLAVCSCPLGSR